MSDDPHRQTMREAKRAQLFAREQLREAVERHQAAAAEPELAEAEVNAAGDAWFRGELDRLRERRPTIRRREPGS
jgi:hypothetical protein